MKNKKIVVCFLAVVMLLVVSSASAYTVRTGLDNKEQITVNDDAYIYGTVRESYLEWWGDWWSRPFPDVTMIARSSGIHREVLTDENGHFEFYLSPGTYTLHAYKEGYVTVFPTGYWYFGEWINGSYTRTWGYGDSAHYAFELLDKDDLELIILSSSQQINIKLT